MNEERVVFGARRPVKILVIAVIAAPIAAGVTLLPNGSTAASDAPSKISKGTIAGIVAGLVALALLVAYAIAWSLIRKMVIEIDGATIHAVSRQPKGEWTFDASQVIEVVRTRDRRNGGDVNVVLRLKASSDESHASPRGVRLPTAYVGRRHEAERTVLDLIRRSAPDVTIPDHVVWIGTLAWWNALPR
jgi:hypothetical protein